MRFYLTTHKRHWVKLTDKPLFLKSEHFVKAVKLYPARGPYAVDSGGFSELQRHGDWTRTPRQYVSDLRRIWECVGPYDWAAPQDWMCEDLIINGGTAGPSPSPAPTSAWKNTSGAPWPTSSTCAPSPPTCA